MRKENEHALQQFFDSGLKLQHLRILVTLADLKQVKRVAQAFNVTQPAISKQIAEMERTLGVDLIARVGQGVEFTPFGLVLVNRGREILHQLGHARKDFDSLLSGNAGSLLLGVVTTVTPVLIPEAITAFQARAPNVSVTIIEGTANKLLPRLERGQFDLVVARTAAPKDSQTLQSTAIAHDPLVMVVSRQHPLAARLAHTTWKDLKGNPWILPPAESPVYQALTKLLHRQDMALPSGNVQSVSLIANIRLISRSSLIGLLPRTLATQHVASGALFIIPLDISSLLGWVHVVWRQEDARPTVSLMRECLEYCGHLHGATG